MRPRHCCLQRELGIGHVLEGANEENDLELPEVAVRELSCCQDLELQLIEPQRAASCGLHCASGYVDADAMANFGCQRDQKIAATAADVQNPRTVVADRQEDLRQNPARRFEGAEGVRGLSRQI